MSEPIDPSSMQIGVHALGEYVFCRRAGLLAFENRRTDQEAETGPPRLDYLPLYEREAIEEKLQEALAALEKWGVRWLLAAVAMIGGRFGGGSTLGWVGLGGMMLCTPWLGKSLGRYFTLRSRHRRALNTPEQEPKATIDTPTAVDWWGLLNAGFDAVSLPAIIIDAEHHLSGRPWRVLQRRDLRIPVVKSGSAALSMQTLQVKETHRIKLAAYAVLLEEWAVGNRSPYGIVLLDGTYQGIAIPLYEPIRREMFDQAEGFRHFLDMTLHMDVAPQPPKDRAACRGCPLGLPVPIDPAAPAAFPAKAPDGKLFHSPCGDRFFWTPPHEVAKAKGLLPPGE